MALFGKGVIWKINQQLYFFGKWWGRHWQWTISTVLLIVLILVTYAKG